MDEATRKRLEAKGWKEGSVAEFLDLSQEEVELIERELESPANSSPAAPK